MDKDVVVMIMVKIKINKIFCGYASRSVWPCYGQRCSSKNDHGKRKYSVATSLARYAMVLVKDAVLVIIRVHNNNST